MKVSILSDRGFNPTRPQFMRDFNFNDRASSVVVTVHAEGKAPYQCPPSATMVPTSAVGKVALGASIPVKVARENPDLLMFEWDKL